MGAAGPGIVVAIAVAIFSVVVQKIIAGSPPKPAKPQPRTLKDRLLETQEPVSPREIVYGVQRKSGNRVFLESTDNSKFLHVVLVLASQEVEAIAVHPAGYPGRGGSV